MCPVELFHESPAAAAAVAAAHRDPAARPVCWPNCASATTPGSTCRWRSTTPRRMARALQAVTRTQRVSVERPPRWASGSDVAARRQPAAMAPTAGRSAGLAPRAHQLPAPAAASRGLVVIDTPGLNAIGAEPELTLGLLPSAHATVFVLAADTGVTKSDLAIWREHLNSARQLERFVVLNKIDALVRPAGHRGRGGAGADPAAQRRNAAATLGLPPDARVRAVGARGAGRPRRTSDAATLERSNLAELEDALVHRPAAAPARAAGHAGAVPAWIDRSAPGGARAASARPPPPAGRTAAGAARPARQERRQGAADAAARGRRVGRVRTVHRAAAGRAGGAATR